MCSNCLSFEQSERAPNGAFPRKSCKPNRFRVTIPGKRASIPVRTMAAPGCASSTRSQRAQMFYPTRRQRNKATRQILERQTMSDLGVQSAADVAPGLSQMQRITNTFTAPSKTFEDIKRGNKSWWMPFILFVIVGYIFFFAVSTKIGMQQVVDNQIHLNPSQEEKLAQAPPEQRAMSAKIALYITEGVFIANPVLLLIGLAVLSLGL